MKTSSRERLATTAIFLVNGLGIGAWAVCIPHLKTEFGLSAGVLGLVLFAFAAGAIIAMPPAGLAIPRLGTGRSARLSGAAFAACLLLPTLAGNLGWLAASACALGAANGTMDVAMNAQASSVQQRAGRPIMSSFHAAFSAGGLCGAGLGALLMAAHAGATSVLLAAAAVTLATLATTGAALAGPFVAAITGGLARPSAAILPLCAAAILCMLCEGAMTDWSAVYLSSGTGAGPAKAAAGYAAFSASMVTGRLAGDRLVHTLGRVRVVRIGGLLASFGLLAAALAPRPLAAICGFALVGFGLSNVVPAIFSAAGERGATPASGIALAATTGYAGFLLGPPLVGAVATAAGLRASMLLLALAAACILGAGRALQPETASVR